MESHGQNAKESGCAEESIDLFEIGFWCISQRDWCPENIQVGNVSAGTERTLEYCTTLKRDEIR